jgi:protein disulfide-isomerase
LLFLASVRRIFLLLGLLLCVSQSARSQGVEWLTDAEAAQTKAKAENKLVLLDFTGSDWCSWCMKLKREVFDRPEFAQFAQSRLVMVVVDFPENHTLPQLQQHANRALKHTYHVGSYPTIVLLDPDGKPLGRTGYVSGGPAAFIAKLEEVSSKKTPRVTRPVQAPEPEKPRKPVTWTPPPPAVPIHYGPLALKSVSGAKDRRIVLINNASMMTGETAKVRVEDREVIVCCKEIRDDSVTITCDGNQMELKLGGTR